MVLAVRLSDPTQEPVSLRTLIKNLHKRKLQTRVHVQQINYSCQGEAISFHIVIANPA